MLPTALSSTDLGLARRRAGKVRDVYDLPEPVSGRPAVLIVATDRISAFDVVLPTPIPGKGRVLTALALAWFGFVAERGHARTHVLAPDASGVGGLTEAERAELRWRTMVGVACEVVPIECVVRGYLDGSGWAEYRETGRVSGVELPAGLERGSRLPEPIFTPATKAERGAHDENITFDEACARVRGDVMERLRATSLAIYTDAHAHAAERGLLLADTKFEFGQPVDERDRADGFDAERLIIVDEALTPDSSRYWDPEKWTPGGAQASFDKQFVRDYLQKLCDGGGWDKSGPGPDLPEDVVRGTFERYLEAARRLFPELRAGALGG
jgi:phosphoribosylaminoimidazole-succinocarboxamide synthase